MTLQALTSISIRFDEQVIRFEEGAIFSVSDAQAQRLLTRAPGRIRPITLPVDPVAAEGPLPPLQAGWIVAFRDHQGRLRGGCEERDQGTVEDCTWDGRGWVVRVTNGQTLPLSIVRSVGQTDAQGRVVACWCVRDHGFDGGR